MTDNFFAWYVHCETLVGRNEEAITGQLVRLYDMIHVNARACFQSRRLGLSLECPFLPRGVGFQPHRAMRSGPVGVKCQ
jgi:hypothetical protein